MGFSQCSFLQCLLSCSQKFLFWYIWFGAYIARHQSAVPWFHGISTSSTLPHITTSELTSFHLVILLFRMTMTPILLEVDSSRVEMMCRFLLYTLFRCFVFSAVKCVSCTVIIRLFTLLHLCSVLADSAPLTFKDAIFKAPFLGLYPFFLSYSIAGCLLWGAQLVLCCLLDTLVMCPE